MGVHLFFVPSGFLIGGQVLAPLARGEPLSLRDFYLRRAFRIHGACGESWIGRRAIPGAAWLAGISYSLYLVHKPIFHLAHDAFGARLGGPSLPAFIVYALLAVAAGALLHDLVERRCLALRQRALDALRPSVRLVPVN